MRDPIYNCALVSVARGCGFAALGIACGMVALSYDPPASLKFGGFAMLLACAILILKAWRSGSLPYKRTETWLILPAEDRPPDPAAQVVIAAARRVALMVFARFTAGFAAAFFLLSFFARLLLA